MNYEDICNDSIPQQYDLILKSLQLYIAPQNISYYNTLQYNTKRFNPTGCRKSYSECNKLYSFMKRYKNLQYTTELNLELNV